MMIVDVDEYLDLEADENQEASNSILFLCSLYSQARNFAFTTRQGYSPHDRRQLGRARTCMPTGPDVAYERCPYLRSRRSSCRMRKQSHANTEAKILRRPHCKFIGFSRVTIGSSYQALSASRFVTTRAEKISTSITNGNLVSDSGLTKNGVRVR